MIQAITLYLQPNTDNEDNTTWPLVSLGCTLGTNITSGIIHFLVNNYKK